MLRLLKQLAQQEEDELEDALPRVPPLPPQKRGLPWAALYNFYHSTCYLNAGLQSFAHNPVLNCALDSVSAHWSHAAAVCLTAKQLYTCSLCFFTSANR